MSADDPNFLAGQGRRLTALEELLTHFERTIGELSSVVLEQQGRIAALEQRLASLVNEVDVVAAQAEPPRRLEDDKPPHY